MFCQQKQKRGRERGTERQSSELKRENEHWFEGKVHAQQHGKKGDVECFATP